MSVHIGRLKTLLLTINISITYVGPNFSLTFFVTQFYIVTVCLFICLLSLFPTCGTNYWHKKPYGYMKILNNFLKK